MLSAGTDPTHIPGLPGLDTVVTDPSEPPKPVSDAVDDQATDDQAEDGEAQDGEAREDEPPAATTLDETADDDGDEDEPPEGPAFAVSDHRGSIAVDGRGVVFRLDDTEARFRWSDIGSVEIGASRFGKRFEVAVGTTDHRRFDAEVIAPTRNTIQEWTEDLDAVLDVWFEDGAK